MYDGLGIDVQVSHNSLLDKHCQFKLKNVKISLLMIIRVNRMEVYSLR